MTACPPDDYLSAVLAGTAPDLPAFDTHLADCAACQRRLDGRADSPALHALRSDAAGRPPEFPFLQPTDRPGCVGRVGRFHVEREVGRGGMGVVFRAWDESLRRPVALKLLRAGRDDAGGAARFAREAQAGAKVSHDHLVPVLSVEEAADGRAVLVLPFVDGPSLRQRLRAERELAPREAAEVVRQVAAGLAAAHAAGLIHRDVKPSNVLLDVADGRAKLTDFGLARPVESGDTLTADGAVAGTPEYLPPEQAADARRAGPPADVYALGVTLYECLTGVVPFRGPLLEVLERHRTEEPVPPRRLNARVPVDLQTVCLKCLEKSPARRYPTAAELEQDLARFLAGEPVKARPLGRVQRGLRWVRRHPLPVALVVVSVVGAGVSAAGWRRAGKKAAEAERQAALADERAGIALSATTTLLTQAQGLPSATPGVLDLKKQLSETALVELGKLTATGTATDKAVAQAHQAIGDTLNSLGRTDDTLAAWGRAVDIAERLGTAGRRVAARGHTSIGFTKNRLLDRPAARDHYRRAVELLEAERAAHPDDAKLLQAMSVTYNGRSDVARDADDPTAALADTDRALEALGRAAELTPDDDTLRGNLAYTHSRAAYAAHARLDFAAAERHTRAALAAVTAGCQRHPDDRGWQQKKAATELELGLALHQLGRFADAEAVGRPAADWFDRASAAAPDDGLLGQQAGVGRGILAMLSLGRGDFAAADAHLADAAARYEALAARTKNPALVATTLLDNRMMRAGVSLRRGRYTEAADRYDQLALAADKLAPTDPKTARVAVQARRFRDALRALPAALSAAEPPADPLVAVWRASHFGWNGDGERARREATTARERFPAESLVHWYAAGVFGVSAAAATDPAERERFQAAGIAALAAAVKLDPSLALGILTAPDLYPLRDHPEYARRLRP